MHRKAYLDNNATTQIDPRVAQVLIEEIQTFSANPSSIHSLGKKAKAKLLQARAEIATYCKCKSQEILFTSGGTESINFLLQGFLNPSFHVLSSNVEHSCVEASLRLFEKKGGSVTFLPAFETGAPSIEAIEAALQPNTKLLVFGAVNGETGVKYDLKALSALAERRSIPLLLDGVALLGKEPLLLYPGITAMAFSAHKCHGPKGVGFVFLRSNTKITPLLAGGGQEYGLRSGTENLPGIVGCAKAVSLLQEELPQATHHMFQLRQLLETKLLGHFPWMQINGTQERICNVSNLSFPGVDAETLLILLDLNGIQASHGSACSSGALEPSRILTNMGLPSSITKSSLRFSLSRFTTQEEILYTIDTLVQLIPQLKIQN